MTYYMNDEKVSKKALENLFGKEKVADRTNEAVEAWREDPLEQISWMDGMAIENELAY